jgi:hypothetical protein
MSEGLSSTMTIFGPGMVLQCRKSNTNFQSQQSLSEGIRGNSGK